MYQQQVQQQRRQHGQTFAVGAARFTPRRQRQTGDKDNDNNSNNNNNSNNSNYNNLRWRPALTRWYGPSVSAWRSPNGMAHPHSPCSPPTVRPIGTPQTAWRPSAHPPPRSPTAAALPHFTITVKQPVAQTCRQTCAQSWYRKN